MPVPETLTCTCPVCDAVLEIKKFDPEIEEPIECAECLNELDWEFDEETNELVLLEPEEDEDGDLIITDIDADETEEEEE